MTLHVALVVPDRELWSGEATTVIAKTTEGDIGVLTGHSPVFGILACLMLMFSLPVENWYRLIVWMVIGFVIYFCYGHRHSELRKREDGLAAAAGTRR